MGAAIVAGADAPFQLVSGEEIARNALLAGALDHAVDLGLAHLGRGTGEPAGLFEIAGNVMLGHQLFEPGKALAGEAVEAFRPLHIVRRQAVGRIARVGKTGIAAG